MEHASALGASVVASDGSNLPSGELGAVSPEGATAWCDPVTVEGVSSRMRMECGNRSASSHAPSSDPSSMIYGGIGTYAPARMNLPTAIPPMAQAMPQVMNTMPIYLLPK